MLFQKCEESKKRKRNIQFCKMTVISLVQMKRSIVMKTAFHVHVNQNQQEAIAVFVSDLPC